MKTFYFAFLFLIFSCSQEIKSPESGSEGNKEESIEKRRDSLPTVTEIQFPSLDSLPIFADLYLLNDTAPMIVLCHQARYNKTEYRGIANKLNAAGFNCLAIDQRSGGKLNNEENKTNLAAIKAGKAVDYLDAEQDILAAINYAYNLKQDKVILWGSSYSSTLALFIALKNEKVSAVISFSPGDYFPELGLLTDELKDFSKPMFVTSSKEEAPDLTKMISKMKLNENQMQFIPASEGVHGSRALWETDPNHKEYWEALYVFLEKLK